MQFFVSATLCFVVLGCVGADDDPALTPKPSVTTTPTNPPCEPDSATESASAGMSLDHYHSGSGADTIAAAFDYDLVVTGAIESVANMPATNDDPPLVTIRIDRILHGKCAGKHVRVIWEPFPHDVDYNIPQEEPRYKAWAKTPLAPPMIGDKYILMVNLVQSGPRTGDYSCRSICRFPFSPDIVQKVLNGLEKRTERSER